MKFKMGDLVHVPSGSYRIVYNHVDSSGQMHIPFAMSVTQKPKIGVFKEYHGSNECVILFNDGEYCVDTRWVFRKENKEGATDARTNNNI